jgi:hypothetical protein
MVTGASVGRGERTASYASDACFLSHPPRTLTVMKLFNPIKRQAEPTFDPFTDPVAYLARFGIEAEVVEYITCLPEAA